jgi:hypothetical protein
MQQNKINELVRAVNALQSKVEQQADNSAMVPAKSVREWYAFYGGEELGISLEHASIVWDAAINSRRSAVCHWTLDVDTCSYDTECGEKWQFLEGTLQENGVVFCHKCGKRVSVQRA